MDDLIDREGLTPENAILVRDPVQHVSRPDVEKGSPAARRIRRKLVKLRVPGEHVAQFVFSERSVGRD
jgi:hypothetical protein